MRCVWQFLALVIALAVGIHALADSDATPSPSLPNPQAVLEQNRRLLEKWRSDPEHFARLERDHQAFLALSPEKQARLRQLDEELHSEDPATQARLWAVLERYVAWLDKLPESDRAWIESASDRETRLQRVQVIRDQQWVKRLPRQVQEKLAKLPNDKQRAEEIAKLRAEDRQRRVQWFWASHIRDAAALKRARPTRLAEFPPEVQIYYHAGLGHLLSNPERTRLREAEGNWPLYARTLAKLMDRPPPELPGYPGPDWRAWPTRFMELPQDWKVALQPYRPQPKRGNASKDKTAEPKQRLQQRRLLAKESGKWPGFAIAATSIVRTEKLKVDTQLGPSKLAQLMPAAQAAIKADLLPKLSAMEKQDLASKEGKWPDYPRRLLDLAKRHGVTIPGTARPCPPEFWEAMSKLLPDVPDRTLRNFLFAELSPEERGELKLTARDAAGRERLLEKYWAKHGDELERQLQPRRDKRP